MTDSNTLGFRLIDETVTPPPDNTGDGNQVNALPIVFLGVAGIVILGAIMMGGAK